MKVRLPNGIELATETDGEVSRLIEWLGAAPRAVLSPEPTGIIREPVETKSTVIHAGSSSEPPERPENIPENYSVPRTALAGAKGGRTRFIDMTDQRCGGWVVLGPAPKGLAGARWRARHACGGVHEHYGYVLRQNPPKSCPTCRGEERAPEATAGVPLATPEEIAAPPRNPRLSGLSTLVGLTFGTWKVVARAGGGDGKSYWKCCCVKCGATKDHPALGIHGLRSKPPKCQACRGGGKKASDDGDEEDEG